MVLNRLISWYFVTKIYLFNVLLFDFLFLFVYLILKMFVCSDLDLKKGVIFGRFLESKNGRFFDVFNVLILFVYFINVFLF